MKSRKIIYTSDTKFFLCRGRTEGIGYKLKPEYKLWVLTFRLSLESKSESEVAQSCLTLMQPYGLSSLHKIFQARILEWVVISFSRETSQPRD